MTLDVLHGLHVNDRVITPSGEVALVTSIRQEFIGLRYVDALNIQTAELSLSARLIRRWAFGAPRPAPVRIPLKAA